MGVWENGWLGGWYGREGYSGKGTEEGGDRNEENEPARGLVDDRCLH